MIGVMTTDWDSVLSVKLDEPSRSEDFEKLEVADDELISGYFRPATSFSGIEQTDRSQYFAVFSDRPQAVTSRLPGQLEFIIERKSMVSDMRGMNQPLNDEFNVSLVHKVHFGRRKEASGADYLRRQQLLQESEILQVYSGTRTGGWQISLEEDKGRRFDHDCLKVELRPELDALAYDVVVRLANLCSEAVIVDLPRLWAELKMEPVGRVAEMTVEGAQEM